MQIMAKYRNARYMYKDEISVNFLRSIRERRKKQKLTAEYVAHFLGVHTNTLYDYEKCKTVPSVARLIQLAEFYGVDISDSINYKTANYQKFLCEIKEKLKKYAISYRELAKLISYSEVSVYQIFNGVYRGSTEFFDCVQSVLKSERESEKIRSSILKRKHTKN